jgi:hypothetical protein
MTPLLIVLAVVVLGAVSANMATVRATLPRTR